MVKQLALEVAIVNIFERGFEGGELESNKSNQEMEICASIKGNLDF